MSKKIKVAGYTKKNNFTDGISYRPFSTLNKSVSNNMIFGSGNFNVTVNTEKYKTKKYKTKDFSDYYNIDSLGIPNIDIIREINKRSVLLNNDKTNLKNYAYFGSLKERVRVAIEQIITKFPAGLILKNYRINTGGDLINSGNVVYFSINNINKKYYITINNDFLSNPFNISLNSQEEVDQPLRNFATSYTDYVIKTDNYEYPITGVDIDLIDNTTTIHFTSNHDIENHYNILVNNEMFLVPNEFNRELFFNRLDNIQQLLLDRTTSPQYTYQVKLRVMLDSGKLTDMVKFGTWITSDGYNLDFDSISFTEYVENLISICDEYDSDFSNILIRRMVASSLLEFDTVSSDINDNIFDSSQKIKSVLSIYGRSFDNIKNYIDSLSFANNITYDKVDNAPDEHVREIAKALGWNLFDTSVAGNWVTDNITKNSIDGMTTEEMEVELWRRLIMNSPYLFKSKGTRRAIELLNKFLGIPSALLNINEFVYKVKDKLNYEEVESIVNNFETPQIITDLPIDQDGYPKLKRNSDDYYFQLAGGWYSQTGGENSHFDTNEGNNPHVGNYDSGVSYLKPLKNMVNSFAPYKYERNIYFESKNNIMTSHYNGSFEGYNIGVNLVNNADISAIIQQKLPVSIETNDCGCELTNSFKALTLQPLINEDSFDCGYDKVVMVDGEYQFYSGVSRVQPSKECCSAIRGKYVYNYTYGRYICTYSDVLDCARFTPIETIDGYHYFIDRTTNTRVDTIENGECCPEGSTPISGGREGYRCRGSLSVVDKCIYIKGFVITDPLKANTSVEFIDSYYTKNVKVFTSGVYNYNVGETVYYNTDINFIVNSYPRKITLQDFIDVTGYEVDSYTDHSLIITNYLTDNGLVDVTIEILFDYVDCINYNDDKLCLVLEEIYSERGTSSYSLVNFKAIYTSAVSNNVIGYNDLNYDEFSYDLSDGKFGLNVIRSTDYLTLHNPIDGRIFEIDIADIYDIPVGSPYAGLEIDVVLLSLPEGEIKLRGKFVNCYDCYPYNSYNIVTDSTYGENYTYMVFISDNNYESTVMGYDYCCPYNSTPVAVNGGFICTVENTDCVSLSTIRISDISSIHSGFRYSISMGLKDMTTNLVSHQQIVSLNGNGSETNLLNIFGQIDSNTALVIYGVIGQVSVGSVNSSNQSWTLTYNDLITIMNSQTNPIAAISYTNPLDESGLTMILITIELNRNMSIVPCDDSTKIRVPCYSTPPLKVTPMPNLGDLKIPISVSSENTDLGTKYAGLLEIDLATTELDLRPVVGNLVTNKTIFIDNVVSSTIGKLDKGQLALSNIDFVSAAELKTPIRFEIGNLDRTVIDKIGVDKIGIDFGQITDTILVPCDEDDLIVKPETPCYSTPPLKVTPMPELGNIKIPISVSSENTKLGTKYKGLLEIDSATKELDLRPVVGNLVSNKTIFIDNVVSSTIGKIVGGQLALSNVDFVSAAELKTPIRFEIGNLDKTVIDKIGVDKIGIDFGQITDTILVPCDEDDLIVKPETPCLDITKPIKVVPASGFSGFQLDITQKNSGSIIKSGSVALDKITDFTISDIIATDLLANDDILEFYPITSVSDDLINFYNPREFKVELSPSTITQISIGEMGVPTYKFENTTPTKITITDIIKPC